MKLTKQILKVSLALVTVVTASTAFGYGGDTFILNGAHVSNGSYVSDSGNVIDTNNLQINTGNQEAQALTVINGSNLSSSNSGVSLAQTNGNSNPGSTPQSNAGATTVAPSPTAVGTSNVTTINSVQVNSNGK